jgi:hypothetical protein
LSLGLRRPTPGQAEAEDWLEGSKEPSEWFLALTLTVAAWVLGLEDARRVVVRAEIPEISLHHLWLRSCPTGEVVDAQANRWRGG